jgi:hypothetical protein
VPVIGPFTVFREIDKAVDAGLGQLQEARARIRWFSAHGMFAGEKSPGDDPIGVGQGPIWP